MGEIGNPFKHNPWLVPSAGLAELAQDIFAQTERTRPIGQRRPRADAQKRRQAIVANHVTNLASCILTGHDYVALDAGHRTLTRYDRPGFPPQVIAEITSPLEDAGTLHRTAGSYGYSLTRLAPTAEFKALIASHGITLGDVGRVEGEEVVVLKSPDVKRPTVRRVVNYRDTAETRRLRAEIERVNKHLRSSELTNRGEAQLSPHLVRQFIGGWDSYGRLHGSAWWQNLPRDQRSGLMIDGEPPAYLDFSSMLLRLAFIHAGAVPPDDDLYSGLDGLEEPTEVQRQAIKRGVSSLFFRNGPMRRLPQEVKEGLGPDWTAARFIAAISKRHPALQSLWGSDIGLRLFRVESNILVLSLLRLVEQKTTGLPLHDALLAPGSKLDLVQDTMRKSAMEITGVALPIKATILNTISPVLGSRGVPPQVSSAWHGPP